MRRQHSLYNPVVGGLAIACLIAALQGCQADEQHAEDTGDGPIHWAYEGETGPERWGELDPSFEVCGSGMQQSPVDLAGAVTANADGLDVRWQPTDAQVVDNGHTIQVDLAEGSAVTLEGREFSLLQFHFHLPSEHTVEGESFPMEVHFVHQAAEGDLAVIGVLMETGEADPLIQSIWDAIPATGAPPAAITGFDPSALLPEVRSYSRYAGSLTTPPCSEIVSWVVMTESIPVSEAQVQAFAALYPMNARPVQALNGRVVRSMP